MWDEVENSVGEKRSEELETDYWKAMIAQGTHTARCRSDDNSPKELIRRVLDQEGGRKVLLQKEMIELGMELKETAAGQQLYSELEVLVEKQLELLQRINRETKAAVKPSVLVALQTEYDHFHAQIDQKLRQMEELKLPLLTRFLHSLRPRQDRR